MKYMKSMKFFLFFFFSVFFFCHSRESGNPLFFCFLFSFFVILNSLLILNSGFLIRHFLSIPGFPLARE